MLRLGLAAHSCPIGRLPTARLHLLLLSIIHPHGVETLLCTTINSFLPPTTFLHLLHYISPLLSTNLRHQIILTTHPPRQIHTSETSIMSNQDIKLMSSDNMEIEVSKFNPYWSHLLQHLHRRRAIADSHHRARGRGTIHPHQEHDGGHRRAGYDRGNSNSQCELAQSHCLIIETRLMEYRSTRLFCARSSTGATIIAPTRLRRPTMMRTPARKPPISMSGTRSSCRSTRRCSLRSSSYIPHPPALPSHTC